MEPIVVVNPVAGRGRTNKAFPEVRRRLAELGVGADVRVSSTPEDPVLWAEEAADDGRMLVAFGGDGLVHSVLSSVAGRVPLGILPSGTGNDFARTLGIPLDPVEAVSLIAAGETRTVDLGRVTTDDGTTSLYTGIASTGFDSEANEVANRVKRLSGTPVYLYSMLVTLARWRGASFTIETDDDTLEISGWLVAAGNSRSYGGGMRVCPEARLDDGLLDLTILGDVGRVEFLRAFPQVFRGTHLSHPAVTSLRAPRVRISADRPFRCYSDGEDTAPLPVTVEAVPDALDVVVGASSA